VSLICRAICWICSLRETSWSLIVLAMGTVAINGSEDESDESVPDEEPFSSEAISRLIRSRSCRKNSARTDAALEGGEPVSPIVIASIRAAYPCVDFLGNGPAWLTIPFEDVEYVKRSALLFNPEVSTPGPWVGLRMKG